MELINAKQPAAVDLCPIRPPAHYSVANMAERRLKPLPVPPGGTTVSDETTTYLMLESFRPDDDGGGDDDDAPLLAHSLMTSFRD